MTTRNWPKTNVWSGEHMAEEFARNMRNDIMIQSLKICGISNKMDSTEDDIFFDNDIKSNEKLFSRDWESNAGDIRFD